MSEKIKDTKVYTKVIKDIKEKILSGQLKMEIDCHQREKWQKN